MQQYILQTLLQYNEIFDALQQLFQLHNYNCNEKKKVLTKYLEENQVKQLQQCIYITFNDQTDFLGFNERILKNEKKINANLDNMMSYITNQYEQRIDNEISNLDQKQTQQFQEFQNKCLELQNEVTQNYQTIQSSRQQQKFLNELIEKNHEEIEFVKQKFVIKQYLDENLNEIRDCIQNISQSIGYLRNDVQLLFSNTKELKIQTQKSNEELQNKLQIVEKDLNQIEDCFNQIGSLGKRIEYYKQNIDQLQEKFKAQATLFQQLEVNNSKVVKFEIHTALKQFQEISNKLNTKQIEIENQVNSYLQDINNQYNENKEQHQNLLQKNDQVNLEFKSIHKQLSKVYKQLEQCKEGLNKSIQNLDLATSFNKLNQQVNHQWRYFNNCINLTKECLDIIQDYCETLQLPSINQEKDLTNLILLLDRRQNELKRNLFQTPNQSSTFYSRTLMRLQTPKVSQQNEIPARIHSLQPKKNVSSRNGSQTISIDSKREIYNHS